MSVSETWNGKEITSEMTGANLALLARGVVAGRGTTKGPRKLYMTLELRSDDTCDRITIIRWHEGGNQKEVGSSADLGE